MTDSARKEMLELLHLMESPGISSRSLDLTSRRRAILARALRIALDTDSRRAIRAVERACRESDYFDHGGLASHES
jgi:hypothetical protein